MPDLQPRTSSQDAQSETKQSEGQQMSVLCIPIPRPDMRIRAVIVIVIYLAAFRIAPGASVPLALGGVLGCLLAVEPARPRRSRGARERAR
jgi:hypothetical protein